MPQGHVPSSLLQGVNPRSLLHHLCGPCSTSHPQSLSCLRLWSVISATIHSAQTSSRGFFLGKALGREDKLKARDIFTNTTHDLVSTRIGGGGGGGGGEPCSWAFYTGSISPCTRGFYNFFESWVFSRGVSIKLYKGRVCPKVQSLILLYAIYDRRGIPFEYLFDRWYILLSHT